MMYDVELEKLIEKIKTYAPNADFDKVEKAYNLAKKAHVDQYRKSGEKYIIHPIAVANILADMQLDIDTICGGLLHDVVEDTEYELSDVEEMFGKDVAVLVDGVTKLGKIKYMTKEESQSENLRKMFLAMAKDMRVILIKLADRLHNMRTLEYMDTEKAKYKAQETIDIYAGIAHRLGISKIKWELEDLSLRYLDPEGYYSLVKKVNMKREQREKYISDIVKLLENTFDEMNISYEVYGRPKHFYSIYRKMKKKNKSFDEIYDLTAVRILVDTVKDCYAVLGVVHTLWKPMPGRFKDYIAMPKPNKYQSLHTTVIGSDGEPVEIQIRTHEMHNIAEYGVAAHWKYKEGITGETSKTDERLQWLRLMMEWEKDVTDPHEFLDALKDDVFNYQVYVFTPQGDVIELPNGATPIDFAYRIHSKIGNSCVGAKINGKIVPLDYKLQNGNIVEIITSANSLGPSRDWIGIVKTPNARNRIRQFFKKERREENIERGTLILEKELKRNHLSMNNQEVPSALKEIGKKTFNQPDYDDFLATIGYGGILANQVITKVKDILLKKSREREKELKINQEENVEIHNKVENEKSKNRSRKTEKRHTGVTVDGLEGIYVRFAKCCNPLPGDSIVGYITRGRGVTVHRSDCENVLRERETNMSKMINVSWIEDTKSKFEAEIQIKANDIRGIVNEITHVISNEKIGLTGIYARKGNDIGITVDLILEVSGIDQLNQVMKKLMNVPGVEETYRVHGK